MIVRPVPACILAAALALACSGGGNPLEDAVIEYQGGSKSSTDGLARGLLEESSTARFGRDDLSAAGSCLTARDGDSFALIDPESQKTVLTMPQGVLVACSAGGTIAASNGQGIGVYSDNGGLLREIPLENTRDLIKAITVHGGLIYYYRGHQLFSQDREGDPPVLVSKDRFSPPSRKFYQANLYGACPVLGLAAGGAGSYYLSAVNTRTGRTLAVNISSSSQRAAFTEECVYYVNGGSGDWTLYRFCFSSKAKKAIRKFREIGSIEITRRGFMFSDAVGLWVQDYNSNQSKVPFDYRISGKLGDDILLSWDGKTYAIDLDRFMGKVDQLKIRVPGIFD